MIKIIKITFVALLILFGFKAKSQDVGITALLDPVSGCQIGTDTIEVTLFNFSPFPIGGTFTMNYSVDGGPTVSESLTTSLNPSTGEDFAFSTLYNFNTTGTYQVCVSVIFIGDINASNNTLCINVINDTLSIGGSITSTAGLVCSGNNSETLTLSGNNNTILQWEYSTDGGSTYNPVLPLNNTSGYSFTNINQQTYYQVVIDGGFCPDSYSSPIVINVDQPSNAGSISGSAVYCSAVNSGSLSAVGTVGTILDWETSITGNFPGTSSGVTASSISYTNLSQTTYYVVIAQNGVCPPDTSSAGLVTILPSSAGGTVTGGGFECESNITGTLTLSGFAGDSIYWIYSTDNGSTWTPIGNNSSSQNYLNINGTVIYGSVVQFSGCPSDTSSFDTVFVNPDPVANAGADDTIFIFDNTTLNGSGGVFYSWSPVDSLSDPNIPNPIADPVISTMYILTVTDLNGCSAVDDVFIFVIDTSVVILTDIIVCNYITSNNDGLNDVWNITGIEYFNETEVTVFNNQGQIVFTENNYQNTWKRTYNGDPLPDGNYYYVVEVGELNKTVKGILTIIGNP